MTISASTLTWPEPQHCAETLLAVVESLWKARMKIAELEARQEWMLPILSGSDDDIANKRTLALAASLMKGLDGVAAIDDARSQEGEKQA